MLAAHADGVAGAAARGRGVLRGQRQGRLRLWPFLGPAFIACVAYIDPGNFATNIAGGSKFGYTLVWVIVAANLMAMLIQTLSAKLGIATGRNLPETCRDNFKRPVSIALWIQAEAIAMATDLAEVIGAALGLHLLFGMPLFGAGLLAGAGAFGILALQRYGFRRLEAVIAGMVGVIVVAFGLEVILARPDPGEIGSHLFVPAFEGSESVLLAAGILGATVMPHVVYLHSALTKSRVACHTDAERRELLRFQRLDVLVALGAAGLINLSMLFIAASLFSHAGGPNVDGIEAAHSGLGQVVGGGAALAFAVALLASGLSSSSVGTYAGQVVMQGFIARTIPIVLRRLITMTPALIVLAVGLNPSRSLVISHVVLSFGIPFALVPLVLLTRRKDIMGSLVNRRLTTVVASVVAGLIIALNLFLIVDTLVG